MIYNSMCVCMYICVTERERDIMFMQIAVCVYVCLCICVCVCEEERGRERMGVCVRERKRSEEHTSELQSHLNLVCRLLLEKKNRLVMHVSRHRSEFTRCASSSATLHVSLPISLSVRSVAPLCAHAA